MEVVHHVDEVRLLFPCTRYAVIFLGSSLSLFLFLQYTDVTGRGNLVGQQQGAEGKTANSGRAGGRGGWMDVNEEQLYCIDIT